MNDYARRALDISNLNTLEKRFENRIIKMSEFFHPYYIVNKDKIFDQCRIVGPASVVFFGVTMIGCEFKHCQVVIVKDNIAMWGVGAFENPVFSCCEVCDLTMVMNQATYDAIKNDDFKKYIPVVSR